MKTDMKILHYAFTFATFMRVPLCRINYSMHNNLIKPRSLSLSNCIDKSLTKSFPFFLFHSSNCDRYNCTREYKFLELLCTVVRHQCIRILTKSSRSFAERRKKNLHGPVTPFPAKDLNVGGLKLAAKAFQLFKNINLSSRFRVISGRADRRRMPA